MRQPRDSGLPGARGLPSPRMSERSRSLPRRSCLSVPGSSEKMLGKAPGLGADMVFLDLEDAVAPLEKEAARDKVVNAINDARLGRDRAVRARERVGHRVDLPRRDPRGREGASERLDELMLPKVQYAAEVHALDLLLTQIEKATGRAVARRHRGADRDRARPHQRRGDLRGVDRARDDHLRSGRLRGVDGDAGAHRRRADPRVPGRPLPLRVRRRSSWPGAPTACR